MIRLELMRARDQAPVEASPYHQWHSPDGATWTEFYQVETGHLLRFPELGDFWLEADGRSARCWPVPGVSEETTRHLYWNQVLPLALSKIGELVFHGSAVAVNRIAMAFVAQSGRGKSTLAAQFAVSGGRFLTDDMLHLESSSTGYRVLPTLASIRLWDDSREHLLADHTDLAPPLCYTPKARLLAAENLAYCDEPLPLRAIYFLGEGTARGIEIERMGSLDAVQALCAHSFLLEIEDRPTLRAHFERVSTLADRQPCYRLDYPRRFEDLPRVQAAIVDHASSQGVAS